MPETYSSTALLKMVTKGLRDIGYQDSLLKTGYSFVDVFTDDYAMRQVDLAAFAHEPPSYRNACFGVVIPPDDRPEAINSYMALGAPQIFTIHSETQKVCRWKFRAQDHPLLLECLEPEQLQTTILAHKLEWNPEQVLRAKSIGMVREAAQLDFFDVGLLPTLESCVYDKLDKLLREAIAYSELAYKEHSNDKLDYDRSTQNR
jgi:hypothetical protein